MTTVRRLQAGSAVTALALAVTCYQVQGHPDVARASRGSAGPAPAVAEVAAVSRFAREPVVTYRTAAGETLFALQLQPQLPPAAPRPIDLIIAVDTSASQSGKPFQVARVVADEIAKAAAAADRVGLWVVNTPDATRALAPVMAANSGKLRDALTTLATVEYPAGAVDLKSGLKKILASLPPATDRRQVVVYLGDGESVLAPLTEADRTALAADFAARQVAFVTVPLGRKLNPMNLHGLASGSGGSVVRWADGDSPAELAKRVRVVAAAPVLYPTRVKFNGEVVEALPQRLPPLRADAPTLVVGRLTGGDKLTATIDGTLDGQPYTATVAHGVPAADVTNFFLVTMHNQWKSADPNAPALVRADRSLALAFEQTRLTRDEVLTQANWALGLNKLDAAEKLFRSAQTIDPADREATAGLKVIDKVRGGQIDPAKLANTDREQVAVLAQDQTPPAAAVAPSTPAAPPADILDQEKRRRAIQEQANRQLVDDVIRKARQAVTTTPDAAYDTLKRQLESVQNNIDLSDSVRNELAARLEGALRTIAEEGRRVTQRQDAELARRLADEARRSALAARQSDEEKVRERIRTFSALMNQARYEEAYKEALVLQQERIAQGRTVPPQAIAAYNMSLNAANLREFEELRRVKEDRFMLTMLQVDRSHIPFPDEPPVAFPPAAVWKTISDLRRGRYDSDGLGQTTKKTLELREKLNQSIDIFKEGLDGVPLREVLTTIQDRLGVTIIVDNQAFQADRNLNDVGEQPVKLPKMPGVTLGTVLRFLLSPFGGTYMVRRDFIEITTFDRSIIDKAVRAYPVADLVIPIPNAVDVNSLNQNLSVLGGQLSANGQAIFGAPQAFQGGGALGFGGALGALGVLGATGSLGGLGGGLGAPGGGGAGFQASGGVVGFGGGNTATNLGFGGGALGFGGGQQGQFGNLGGQFGIQGGDTSGILIQLIQDTIAPKEWNTTAARYITQNFNQAEDEEAPALSPDKLNSLGYYQPSRALVVRGSSRIHTRISSNIGTGAIAGGAMGPKKNPDAFAKADKPWQRGTDAKTTWHQNMAMGAFKPRQVIAVADVLAHAEKFEDVAELLKADLRHGVLAHECVYEALAVALQTAGAAIEEVERVRLSRVDVQPANAEAFLETAQHLAEMGRTDRARDFCQRAASLNPNEPDAYAKALAYAGQGGDRDLDVSRWAADNLLKREWGNDAQRLHLQAKQTLEQLAKALDTQGRADDARRVRECVSESRTRDLVIDATWGDHADVDLTVHEPVGTVCSAKQRLTPAGGRWVGDKFDANRESYVAAEAFAGSYVIEARRVWGKPLANKVHVKVTSHFGTPNESVELHTLVLDATGRADVKVNLESGRRTNTMAVPSKVALEGKPVPQPKSPDQVFGMLRSMADPVMGGLASGEGLSGGVAASGPAYIDPNAARSAFALESGAELSLQTKIAPAVSSGVDLTTRTVISGDRKSMTVSFNPIFDADKMAAPKVTLAFIPGGM